MTSILLMLLVTSGWFPAPTSGISVTEHCTETLGMEDGRIKDYQLTASSSYEPSLVGPTNARLYTEAGGGAWCPKSQIEDSMKSSEYLEIDLLSDHIISSVLIQGRYGNGLGQEYTEYFALEYRSTLDQQYIRYTDNSGISVLPANTNTFQVTQYNFTKIVVADAVRIFPLSEYPRTVCMRVELTGCPYSGNLLAMLMEASGGLEDLEELYPQSRSEDPSIKLYLAIAIGIFVTVICASIAAVAIAIYRSRIQSRKPFTSQYNFVSGSERDSSIPSDPASIKGHVTLINNTASSDYGGYGGGGENGGHFRSLDSGDGMGLSLTTSSSPTAPAAVVVGGTLASLTSHVAHLPPSGSVTGGHLGTGVHHLTSQTQKQERQQRRARSRSARPRGGANPAQLSSYVRRSSLDERNSGGSVSSARSAESVTRPVENTDRDGMKSVAASRSADRTGMKTVEPSRSADRDCMKSAAASRSDSRYKNHNGMKENGDVIRFALQKPVQTGYRRQNRKSLPIDSDEEDD